MTEKRAVIKVQFRIQRDYIILFSYHQRIDFSKRAVLSDECVVEAAHELRNLADGCLGEIHVIGHAGCLEGCKANSGIDVFLEDLVRHLCGNLLNFHAAFLGAHHNHTGSLTVDNKGKIILLLDVGALLD